MTEAPQVGTRPVRYAPRTLGMLAPEPVRGWLVKRYAVSALRDQVGDEVSDFARRAVLLSLPEPHPDGPSHACSVVHEDEDGCYVVVAWWSRNRLILHSRTWLAGWDSLTEPAPAPGHATACIWELVALGAERDAWVRHVVQPERPDFASYLAAGVTGRY